MFAYDLIKRNKCLITIGKTQKSGLTMVAENAAKDRKEPPKDRDGNPVEGPVFESSGYQAEEVRVPCYFLSTPKISFQSNFSEQNDLLSDIMGPVTAGLHTANMALPALSDLNNNFDDVKNAGASLYNTVRQSYASHKGDKTQFNADKRQAAIDALGVIGKTMGNAMSQETRTFRAGNVVAWQGSSPVEFSLEVLFCKPNGGVHMGALYPLMEASSFSELMFGNFMYGPRGYNSAGFGISAMQRILNGEFPSLHSLTLWHSAEDDFNNKRAYTRNIVLDLFRLLVITSVQIDKSEQLFFDPSGDGLNTAPLYKWIKATIGFKTACPIPGTLWQFSDKGNRPNGRTNASAHDFYGSADASFSTAYPNPIGDVETIQGWDDYTRLTGFGKSLNDNGETFNSMAFDEFNIKGEGKV